MSAVGTSDDGRGAWWVLADGLLGGAAELRLVFPAQHLARLEHIGKGRGHMADLVARRLLVPAEDGLVDQGARCLGHGQRGRQEVGEPLGPLGEPEEPVGRNAERGRAFRHDLGIRQPCALVGQKLRDGRPVDTHRAREAALRHPPVRHGLRQTVPEQAGAGAFVDICTHR